jgi:hypothetical protein
MDHDLIVEQLLDRCKCFERNRFEFSQATRLNRTVGWYFGLLA